MFASHGSVEILFRLGDVESVNSVAVTAVLEVYSGYYLPNFIRIGFIL